MSGKSTAPEQLVLAELAPWMSAPSAEELLDAEHQAQRASLLQALADSKLATIEQRVCTILRDHPETRDSDTALHIQYWRRFQAPTLLEWDRLDLDILFDLEKAESLSRARRHIQNDLSLFQATPRTQELRGELQLEFQDFLLAKRDCESEIRFYIDETGTDPQDRYTGIGGICVLDYRQFEMQHTALSAWRKNQSWPQTLHLNKVTNDIRPHLALLSELSKRRAGLLFVGYALPTRSRKNDVFLALMAQLLVDSLRHAEALGCLNAPRALTIVKENEDGFDRLHLALLERSLREHLAREFPGRVYLRTIETLPKGREVLLECADLIASGMRRREFYGGTQHKDLLAEAVMNVTGFEDQRDHGAVFRHFQF